MEKIEFPYNLNNHTLTEQELAELSTPGRQALAKDWNILNRKIDWLIREAVATHNLLADHDKAIDSWRKIYWLLGLIGGSFVTGLGILKAFGVIK